MSLDVYLRVDACTHCHRGEQEVYSFNITHNLGEMAKAAGMYKHLWAPEELDATKAEHLIAGLEAGLDWLKLNPDEAKKHNPPNGWGTYENFVSAVNGYLIACKMYPNAHVSASR